MSNKDKQGSKGESKDGDSKNADSKKADSKKKPSAKSIAADAAKAEVAARKKARNDAKSKRSHLHNLIPKGKKSVKVLGLVNMHCLDGCLLQIGKECFITEAEATRLEGDARGDFFKRVK